MRTRISSVPGHLGATLLLALGATLAPAATEAQVQHQLRAGPSALGQTLSDPVLVAPAALPTAARARVSRGRVVAGTLLGAVVGGTAGVLLGRAACDACDDPASIVASAAIGAGIGAVVGLVVTLQWDRAASRQAWRPVRSHVPSKPSQVISGVEHHDHTR